MAKIVVCLIIFWVMQVASHVLLKWGSMPPESNWRYYGAYAAATIVGSSSVLLLMALYKVINVNVAMGIAMGGMFPLSQITLSLIFHSRVTPVQWFGIAAISIGIFALSVGGAKPTQESAQSGIAASEQEG